MKQPIIISLLLLITINVNGQFTNIPDPNFEQALINLGYDTVIDGQVLTASINTITGLDVSWNGITDLNGIEDFISLDSLSCHVNQLTELDVSSLTSLYFFDCQSNDLKCLNIKNGNNTNLTTFYAGNNPYLTCIQVDSIRYSMNNWMPSSFNFVIDTPVTFSNNCGRCIVNSIAESSHIKTSIYPNPTLGLVIIEFEETKSNVIINIINTLGQVILNKNYSSVNTIKLNIDAPSGIYYLRLESEGKVFTKKIIKE